MGLVEPLPGPGPKFAVGVVARRGEAASEFLFLTSGEVVMEQSAADRVPHELAGLSAGWYSGEMGLQRGTVRSAMVRGDLAMALYRRIS